jgi:two-component system chemotaxis response regulator CheB
VDDSALMRKLLSDILSSSPEIEVVGSARDGRDAVVQTARLKPDVVTLDVEMPEVSGLDALPSILAVHEARVVMVSALTKEGADVTLQALELGAVDFLLKPDRNQLAEMRGLSDLLVSKILTAAQSRVRRPRRFTAPSPSSPAVAAADSGIRAVKPTGRVRSQPCVVIGISTGGPQALSQVVSQLAPPLPPILIVQHMPAQFTGVFAERLNRSCALVVKEASEGDRVLPDQILVAPGGRQMSLAGIATTPRVVLSDPDEPAVSGHKPSVDVLMQSAAKLFQSAAVGVLMTGMGRDGVDGCKAILTAGGFTLGQDEATSVVYGMNKAGFLEGAVLRQFALEELPALLKNLTAVRDSVEGK